MSLRNAGVVTLGRQAQRRAPDAVALLSALPVPMVVLDAENRFTYANHAAEHFLGVSASQLAQMKLVDLVPPDHPAFMLLAQVRQGEVTVSDHDMTFESPRLRKRGIAVQCAPLPEEPGSVLLVLQDASAARALDRQLTFRSAARSVTSMAAIR